MLATMSPLPTNGGEWGYEFKWDGIRAILFWDGSRVRIDSRNLLNITAQYPEFDDLGRWLPGPSWVLDGEILALDSLGRPSFALLQQRMHLEANRVSRVARRVPVWYFVFDALYAQGHSLLELPLRQRRIILENLPFAHKKTHSRTRISPLFFADGHALLQTAKTYGLEGVVAKRLDSKYQPGYRSPYWRKTKLVKTEDLVIGGWSPQKQSTRRIGALGLGYYDKQGRFRYAGSVGTGFSDQMHQKLVELLDKVKAQKSPFYQAELPRLIPVKPCLVIKIEYRRWPKGGQIQQASFKGLRGDKLPKEIVLEKEGSESWLTPSGPEP
jgi:bifunctional non-homologous end joining protein LigD